MKEQLRWTVLLLMPTEEAHACAYGGSVIQDMGLNNSRSGMSKANAQANRHKLLSSAILASTTSAKPSTCSGE